MDTSPEARTDAAERYSNLMASLIKEKLAAEAAQRGRVASDEHDAPISSNAKRMHGLKNIKQMDGDTKPKNDQGNQNCELIVPVVDLLLEAKRRGIKVAIATGGDWMMTERKMIQAGLLPYTVAAQKSCGGEKSDVPEDGGEEVDETDEEEGESESSFYDSSVDDERGPEKISGKKRHHRATKNNKKVFKQEEDRPRRLNRHDDDQYGGAYTREYTNKKKYFEKKKLLAAKSDIREAKRFDEEVEGILNRNYYDIEQWMAEGCPTASSAREAPTQPYGDNTENRRMLKKGSWKKAQRKALQKKTRFGGWNGDDDHYDDGGSDDDNDDESDNDYEDAHRQRLYEEVQKSNVMPDKHNYSATELEKNSNFASSAEEEEFYRKVAARRANPAAYFGFTKAEVDERFAEAMAEQRGWGADGGNRPVKPYNTKPSFMETLYSRSDRRSSYDDDGMPDERRHFHEFEATVLNSPLFDALVCSNDLGRPNPKHTSKIAFKNQKRVSRLNKPRPDLYLKAAQKLGVRPEDCVAVEDTYIGMLAASRAGYQQVIDARALTNYPLNFDLVAAMKEEQRRLFINDTYTNQTRTDEFFGKRRQDELEELEGKKDPWQWDRNWEKVQWEIALSKWEEESLGASPAELKALLSRLYLLNDEVNMIAEQRGVKVDTVAPHDTQDKRLPLNNNIQTDSDDTVISGAKLEERLRLIRQVLSWKENRTFIEVVAHKEGLPDPYNQHEVAADRLRFQKEQEHRAEMQSRIRKQAEEISRLMSTKKETANEDHNKGNGTEGAENDQSLKLNAFNVISGTKRDKESMDGADGSGPITSVTESTGAVDGPPTSFFFSKLSNVAAISGLKSLRSSQLLPNQLQLRLRVPPHHHMQPEQQSILFPPAIILIFALPLIPIVLSVFRRRKAVS